MNQKDQMTGQLKKRYFFEEILACEMCGDDSSKHKVTGIRLNRSIGLKPRKKDGISVAVKRCRNCGLLYSSPQPIPFDIQDHYGIPPEHYWHSGYFKWDPGYFNKEITRAKELLNFKTGMKALDIGAGLGKGMLSLSQAGFDTYGFEPSKPFYDRALSEMKIDPSRLKLGMVENMEYETGQFDFISFSAVFEHLYHPAQSLEKALRWLKPGGIIHIEVPSSKHLIAKIINFYYRLAGTNYVTNLSPMHEPFHMYEFGFDSFTALGKKLNYTVVGHTYYVCEILSIPRPFHFFLRHYMKWTNTGMQLTVWLKK
jgi:SAM-dependent methyltransferase